MTYQQSLEMIERLKNTAWSCSTDWILYFDFKSETEFEIIYFSINRDGLAKLRKLMQKRSRESLPVAHISFEKEVPTLLYDDKNVSCTQNLLTSDFEYHDSGENVRYRRIHLQLDMAKLSWKLKNL